MARILKGVIIMLDCENSITYKKVDPSEVIEVGDVVMIDPANGYITRAVMGDRKEFPINTRMVVGYDKNL